MAASRGLNFVRKTAPFQRNEVFSILLASVTGLRQASLTHPFSETWPHIRRRNNSSLSKTELESSNSNDSVDILGVTNIMEHPDFFEVHKLFTIRDLFDAKVHLGHHKGCWSPLMKPYLYGRRSDYHIINLSQTAEHLRLALNVLSHIVYRHGIVLFVSTHPRFEELTQRTARECREYFITRKWRGGTFTNSYMVTGLTRNPDVVIFLHLPSLGRNTLAVKEAAQANIPSIGIVDSDCNPNLIMYPIPGNDDTPSAVELYCTLFKTAVLRAKQVRNERRSKQRADDGDEETPKTVVRRNEQLADAEEEELKV